MAVAVGVFAIFRLARLLLPLVTSRQFLVLPVTGLAVSGLAIAFSEATDKCVEQRAVLGRGRSPALVSGAGTWSLSALALLMVFKGLAYAVSLASFRGGPVFPAIFLGAAAGLMAAHLAGFAETPAVAVGIGAALVAALGLPLSAVVLAMLLTSQSGPGASPVIIVGVVVAYVTTRVLSGLESSGPRARRRRARVRERWRSNTISSPAGPNGGPTAGSAGRGSAPAQRRISDRRHLAGGGRGLRHHRADCRSRYVPERLARVLVGASDRDDGRLRGRGARETSGKALASVLMLGGLAFLSIVTATITSAFIARRQAEMQETGEDPVIQRLDQISSRLDDMETELSRLGGMLGLRAPADKAEAPSS